MHIVTATLAHPEQRMQMLFRSVNLGSRSNRVRQPAVGAAESESSLENAYLEWRRHVCQVLAVYSPRRPSLHSEVFLAKSVCSIGCILRPCYRFNGSGSGRSRSGRSRAGRSRSGRSRTRLSHEAQLVSFRRSPHRGPLGYWHEPRQRPRVKPHIRWPLL